MVSLKLIFQTILVGKIKKLTDACLQLRYYSDTFGNLIFDQLNIEDPRNKQIKSTGRPTYVSNSNDGYTNYLYHTIDPESFQGMWIIALDMVEPMEYASAYFVSWAITPYLTREVTENVDWMANINGTWYRMPDTVLECASDETLYFDSHPLLGFDIGGYYVLRNSVKDQYNSVYSHVSFLEGTTNKEHKQAYLYHLDGKWMIGNTIGVDSCLSYTVSGHLPVGDSGSGWKFVKSDGPSSYVWLTVPAKMINRRYPGRVPTAEESEDPTFVAEYPNIIFAWKAYRSLKSLPEGQKYHILRNEVPMPVVGLGTGGFRDVENVPAIVNAIEAGYRLFDLAREYKNEDSVPMALQKIENKATEKFEDPLAIRSDLFIESKVWPTDLGFYETSTALYLSLRLIQSMYIDLYLLHWPVCNPEIEWMRCQEVKNPSGTWMHSWPALEKAYAEGFVVSIGVSNFDADLLRQMGEFAVYPHVIQNWAEPGSIDKEVLSWCQENNAIYQTYATLRNLDQLSSHRKKFLKRSLHKLSKKYGKSEYAIALKLMVQNGMAVIPRSLKREHLEENLNIFDWELLSEEVDELWN